MDREGCLDLPCDGGRLAGRRWVGYTFRVPDSALQSVPPDATGPGGGVGLYHTAVELDDPDALAALDDLDALAALGDRLTDREVAASPVDHGINTALYVEDHAGNGLEGYADTRDAPEDRWAGTNRPFRVSDAAP